MKRLFLMAVAAMLAVPAYSAADTITQWTFNGADASSVPGGTASPTPATGTGVASLIGGTTASFASGIASGGSSDPVNSSPPNFGWNVTTWPAATANNETAGVQFTASTAGYENISVSWDQRHSNSASRFFAFYYTTDGTNWTRLSVGPSNATPGVTPVGGNPASTPGLFGNNGTFSAFDGTVTGAGDDWFNGRSVDLSSITGVNDNPNFGFRIVSSFDDGSNYVSSSANAYATTGTSRFDMVTISGTVAIPEPSAAAAGLLALSGLIFRRRRS